MSGPLHRQLVNTDFKRKYKWNPRRLTEGIQKPVEIFVQYRQFYAEPKGLQAQVKEVRVLMVDGNTEAIH